jgi:MFS family permease
MLFRFSLYGFLKNQKYYEPFLYLALLEKGLSFTAIGLLIGLRELLVNLLELPTGAIADVVGRQRSMIASFVAYVASFGVLGLATPFWALAAGMSLYAVGEAFRTGTHKAMIFDWLAREGRLAERTRVYGYTRSWSKRGSAVSVVIAALLVFATDRYTDVFLWCAVPYALGIANFLGYPRYLDGAPVDGRSLGAVLRMLVDGVREAMRNRPLRRLLVESAGFEGTFKVVKGYLQPMLESLALALPFLVAYGDRRRTAVLVGAVYVVLHLLGSRASRGAHRVEVRSGSADRAAGRMWVAYLVVFGAMAAGLSIGLPAVAAAGFVVLAVIQDTWRPIMISRIDAHAPAERQATVLSIESQAQSLFSAAVAPLVGIAVDALGGDQRFLPVAAVGIVVSVAMLVLRRTHR